MLMSRPLTALSIAPGFVKLTVESITGRADFQRIDALQPIGKSPQKTRDARKVFVDFWFFVAIFSTLGCGFA